ncbi:MAG TPA: sugar phosphate isomerase/epimerase family protein [Candidatus Glassbacteria bacterium]|nr:sugar phosphate isomerase/epimerase family protein [Candidatus Glassbacteria bacterium]
MPINRREFLALATLPLLSGSLKSSAEEAGGMFVCMHEITSITFDFRTAMEGYARAGLRAVEPDLGKVREFAEKESPGMARQLLDDLGLKAVSCSNQLFLEESGPRRAGSLEELKWKLELAEVIGADRMVIPSAASEPHTIEDYEQVIANLREAADIAQPHHVTLMVEFTRLSTLINNLRTALKVVREADHSHLKVMLDTFHFWSGMSKFEDLELLRDGELHHLHFEDIPGDQPLETFGQQSRVFPGEGIAPLRRIVELLQQKGYRGPASLELFNPVVQATDPYAVAMQARRTIEPLIA